MLEPGSYKLNKAMTMVDVEVGRMFPLPYGELIEVGRSIGAGRIPVKSSKGEFVAMEKTLKELYLDGWIVRPPRRHS